MSNLKNILKSFKIKSNLCPKVWDNIDGTYVLKSNIRENLLKIAYEFFDSIGVDVIISDITFTGSLANFNWSNFSDIDLHLMADFKQFNENELPLYKELFLLKKTIFNDKHDITILGYDVELYIQDENEEHTSTGVYSVLNNEWIVEPKFESEEIDINFIKKKSENWMKEIDSVIELSKGESLDDAKKLIKKFKEKIKKYRSCGLEKGGEYSIENLVFKVLRRNGYIEKLFNVGNKLVDDKLSIKEDEIKDPKLAEPEKAKIVKPDVEEFYKTLENINSNIYQQESGNYSFQKEVESVQIALDILGYPLPRFGVDGKFGPETANAVNGFKKDNNLKLTESFNKENYIKSLIKEALLSSSVLSAPLVKMPAKINHPFGEVRRKKGGGTRLHMGTDLGAESGTKIIAPADGVVISAGFFTGNCGGTIKIKHGGGYETLYCHCKSIDVKEGDVVKKFDVIGLSGGGANDKGRGNSKGPHLHFGLKINGKSVDPMEYLDSVTIPSSSLDSLKTSSTSDKTQSNSFISPEMGDKLVVKLKEKGLKSEDLEKYTKKNVDFSDVVAESDEEFYKEILRKIGAPVSAGNLRFFHAWAKAEGAKPKFNPFATTWDLDEDKGMTYFNCLRKISDNKTVGEKPESPTKCKTGAIPGVKNYSTAKYGIEALVKTLLKSKADYSCIVNGLKNELPPEKISKCDSLYRWGTEDGISKVLNSEKFSVPPIVGFS